VALLSVNLKVLLVGGTALLCLEAFFGLAAHAQVNQPVSDGATKGINLGGRGWSAPEATVATPPKEGETLQFSAKAGLASDYIYRGTTLSDRKPAVGAAIEAAFSVFYAAATVASVKLPTQPAAEITMTGGIRPTVGNVSFDFGWTYFLYPGEIAPVGGSAGIEYWEALARADTTIGDLLRVAGGFAYSPNVSNTGAWSKYAAFGVGVDLPSGALPQNVTASLTGGAGYFWFGNQSAELGGFPLPAYLNWNAGVTFTRNMVNLDLRYYDTNLSKEDCFVFTGDPNATPGGSIDPVRNPEGLRSRWCSATFVAKFWFALN
jgi:uncharacterized protein (TIGR02001 family)